MSKKGVRPPSIKFFVFFPKDEGYGSTPIVETVGEALYTKRRNIKRSLNQQMKAFTEHCLFPPAMLPENQLVQSQLPTPPIPMEVEVSSSSDQFTYMTSEPEYSFATFAEGQEDEFSLIEQDHISECGIFADDF